MNLYKKCTVKVYSLLVIVTTFALDNPLRLCALFERKKYKD